MRNQILMWALFVVPWLTVFFMKKEYVKRFMPVAIFSALGVIILNEIGMAYSWWAMWAISFPLRNFHPDYVGLFPAMTLWVFRFTFSKFWLFFAAEIILNLGFGFVFVGWFLPWMGILHTTGKSGAIVFGLATGLGILLYWYQTWQEGIFAVTKKT